VVWLDEKLFTTGEFASMAGTTLRTLRYYDTIGLLKPSKYDTFGRRFYSKKDFGRLQKILTLKFIGLSLDEIENIIKKDADNEDLKKSLEIQRDILNKKMQHMASVIEAIDETLEMFDEDKSLDWDKFVNIIKLINIDKDWMEQYENSSNLKARINIHELFSINKYGWMPYFFEQINLKGKMKILELGCGDGSLWVKNYEKLPKNIDITLTDFSPGMLEDAKNNLGKMQKRFKFKIVDAETIPYKDETFDVVIANHMLYHVNDIDKAFSEIYRALKKGGVFYAATVGKSHMKEMRSIVSELGVDMVTTKSFEATEKFQLENGMDIFKKWFKDIKLTRYDDGLFVTEATPLLDYILSMPGNTDRNFSSEEKKYIIDFLEKRIKESGGIKITKDTGFFTGYKK
jgi:ubiquinone/menaquinone biosynthesis C-methylase UbiE/DNA-binding transcriptional MerR regulator